VKVKRGNPKNQEEVILSTFAKASSSANFVMTSRRDKGIFRQDPNTTVCFAAAVCFASFHRVSQLP
jgi:hypothetical protein